MSSILNAPKIPFKKPNTIPSKFVLNCSNALTVKKELDLLFDIEDNQSSSYSTRNSDESLNDNFTNVNEMKGVSIIDALINLKEQCKFKL